MSSTQHAISIARRQVKLLIDRAQINTTAPGFYRRFIDDIYAPQGSPLLNSMMQFLYQKTQGQWYSPDVSREWLMTVLRGWINQELRTQSQWYSPGIAREQFMGVLRAWTSQELGTQAAYLQPAGVGGGQTDFGQQPTYYLNPTSNMYEVGPSSGASRSRHFSPEPIVMEGVSSPIPTNDISTDYNLGRPISIKLHRAPSAELSQPPNDVLSVRNYHTGDYEKSRLLTSEITLELARNSAADAGRMVYLYAPQEVIRGLFANVILYQELRHVPMGYKEFISVVRPAWEAYSKENNWRAALKALTPRTAGEWQIMNRALCQELNDLIYRRIRADEPGVMTIGIESLNDLSVMDTQEVKSAAVKHAKYWDTLNWIVAQAFDNLFNPKNLVNPDDQNFGDFVNCDEIMFCADGRSKADYGTFAENVDRAAFIDRMMATDTVVRIPRSAILTNALDPRLVAQVKRFKPTEQLLLSGINTVGTSLIGSLDYLRRGDVQDVVCLDLENKTETVVKIGTTLDGTLTLLNPNH